MKKTVLYKDSVDPVWTDGRDIDQSVGELSGEGSQQKASGAGAKHIKSYAREWKALPEPNAADPTYYDRPMLNAPVWEWAIPTYYYIGGLTGASLVLAAAAQLGDSRPREGLIRRAHWIGAVGVSVSGALLVYDLGVPSRFYNMLRVFRPTSVMNMGAWILSGTSATGFGALLFRGRSGMFGLVGETCGYLAGLFGAALATYTGVLVSGSAVPVWQASRHMLPLLFGASAMSSVGAFFEIFSENPEERRITNVFGAVGQGTEIIAAIVMEKQASVVPRVGRPFKRGLSGFLWRAAAVLTIGTMAAAVIPNRSRKRRILVAALGTVGSALMRMSIEKIGTASAKDARASFHQQRAGYGAAEVTKKASQSVAEISA
jgi:formate-dependent nitrite reductase membrane component NrfD